MNTTEKPYIHIYCESSPNPNSMKFVMNFIIMEEDTTCDFQSAEEAQNAPLATELFEKYDFITRIFFMKNFITISKTEGTDWNEVTPVIRNFIRTYLEEKKPIFTTKQEVKLTAAMDENDTEAVKKIKGVLDEYIKPAVQMDGGAIVFDSYDEETGIVKVSLQGSCSGCPSSTITLKSGIENLLKNMVPGVKEVVATSM